MASLTSFSGTVPQNYETYLGPLFFEPYAADLAQRLKSPETKKTVLEIACGTSRLTKHLLAHLPSSAQLIATDLNADMVEIAKKITSANNVQWQVVDAHELPFENEAFDTVVCQYGVMFFEDKAKAFSEIARVLQPGGTFLFNTWDELKYNALSLMAQKVLEEIYPDDPPRFLDKGPYSFYDKVQIRMLLTDAGFNDIHLDVVTKFGTAASPEAAVKGILEGTPNFAYIAQRHLPASVAKEKLTARLIEQFGKKNLELPMQAFVIEARKA